MSYPLVSPVPRSAACLAGAILLLALGAADAASAAAVLSPSVTSIDPDSAFPGEQIVLAGEGLDGPTSEYFTWVRTQTAGFVLDAPIAAAPGKLAVLVGPVATAGTGSVELWRGRGYAVPSKTLRIQGRLISASQLRVFVPHEETTGGPRFSALGASPWTSESGLAPAGYLAVNLGPWNPPIGDADTIRVDAVIETGGESESTGEGLRGPTFGSSKASTSTLGTGSGPSWAFHLVLESNGPLLSTAGTSGAATLAAALSQILTEQLGSMGLTATANGSQLVLNSVGGIRGGFVTISLQSP